MLCWKPGKEFQDLRVVVTGEGLYYLSINWLLMRLRSVISDKLGSRLISLQFYLLISRRAVTSSAVQPVESTNND